MAIQNISLLLSVLATFANAAPATENVKRAGCIFTGAINPTTVASQLSGCTAVTINAAQVPAGKTLDLSGLKAGTTVHFQGNTTFGVQKGFAGPLINIGGTNIVVTADANAVLEGFGQQYWDGQGSNGNTPKPKFFAAHNLLGKSSITGVKLVNTPVQAVSINGCSGLTISHMTIDNSASDGLAANKMAHNTDGFDIGASSNINIDNAVVHNQDDCVAINSGTDITFTNGQCTGGHGLSIGSVGHGSTTTSNTVERVKFLNSKVSNSVNGVRVKSFFDGKGKIDAVTFSGITLSGISGHGVIVEQNYDGGDLSKTHGPGAGVPITGLTLSGITGTGSVAAAGTNVAIECAACTGWTWSSVAVTGGKKFSCVGTPSVVPAGVCA